jgi:hypothetical protein
MCFRRITPRLLWVNNALHASLWDHIYLGDDDGRFDLATIKMLLSIEDPAEASNGDPKECHKPNRIVGQKAGQNREDTSPKGYMAGIFYQMCIEGNIKVRLES